uniref:Uncharacterized protein n=1 Tax=Lygus hesperus TaxID=30085 RepID=A0A0A9WN57_LYGHE
MADTNDKEKCGDCTVHTTYTPSPVPSSYHYNDSLYVSTEKRRVSVVATGEVCEVRSKSEIALDNANKSIILEDDVSHNFTYRTPRKAVILDEHNSQQTT